MFAVAPMFAVDMQAVALPVCSSFQLLMQGSRHAVLEFVAWE